MTEPRSTGPGNGSEPGDIAAALAADPPGGAGEVEGSYPLSPLQSWILFESLYRPEPAAGVEQMTCLLAGELDGELFGHAWQAAVDRHPALRSAFVWEGVEQPVQVVLSQVTPTVERQDWRRASAG